MAIGNENPKLFSDNKDNSRSNSKSGAFLKRPWKKSFRKLPASVEAKLDQYGSVPIKVASVRDVPVGQIANGLFRPIGIFLDQDNELCMPNESVLPLPESGTWARRNVEGWDTVLRDLPKENRTFSFEVPNFGDWSKGSHEISFTRECFQREVIGPLYAAVTISKVDGSEDGQAVTLSFELDYTFDPAEGNFEKQLLMGINLLQEATGCSDVFPADASMEEILETRVVNWEILPPGTSEKTIVRSITQKHPSVSPGIIAERFEILSKLKPEAYIKGTNMGTTAYFGAKFADDLVVFENIKYGNAIYVMRENWEDLSKRSRTELLRNPAEYARIVHRKGWQRRLKHLVESGRS